MAHLQPGATISLNHFLITSILTLLIISKYSVNAVDDYSAGVCMIGHNHTSNQTTIPFQNNLQTVLEKFRSESASRSYDFHSAGNPPDKAYGFYLCRGDTTPDLCSTCITNLTDLTFLFQTTDCWEKIAFTDYCMIHYADYSFRGGSNNTASAIMLGNSDATREYNRTVKGVFESLITDVANIGMNVTRRYATREASVGRGDEKVYGLAQCTPDISQGNCSECLKSAFSNFEECCGGSKFAFVVLPSCLLRYDNTSFYVVSAPVASTNSSGVSTMSFPISLVAVSGLFFINWLFFIC